MMVKYIFRMVLLISTIMSLQFNKFIEKCYMTIFKTQRSLCNDKLFPSNG
jgi:hypothetical protein